MWAAFLLWLKDNQIGDVTGVIGIVISVIGFCFTSYGVFKSKGAAERAELAADEARRGIRMFEAAVDFGSAISLLEEIKRAHRHELWVTLPDRYAAVRKILISLRHSKIQLSELQETSIQSALSNLVDMEIIVEGWITDKTPIKSKKIKSVVISDLDNLLVIFSELRHSKVGGASVA